LTHSIALLESNPSWPAFSPAKRKRDSAQPQEAKRKRDSAQPQEMTVEKLARHHDLSSFDCGKPALDDWLKRFALTNQQSDSARTYVVEQDSRVVG
jgi:hypothetical protein